MRLKDGVGNALGSSIADQMSEPSVPPVVSAQERQSILDLFADGLGAPAAGGYTGGQAFAADFAARKAASSANALGQGLVDATRPTQVRDTGLTERTRSQNAIYRPGLDDAQLSPYL